CETCRQRRGVRTTRLRRPQVSAIVFGATRVHRIPCPTFVTIAKRPFCLGRDARDVEVIWVKREWKYFCEGDWTTQIRLKPKENFFSAVIPDDPGCIDANVTPSSHQRRTRCPATAPKNAMMT